METKGLLRTFVLQMKFGNLTCETICLQLMVKAAIGIERKVPPEKLLSQLSKQISRNAKITRQRFRKRGHSSRGSSIHQIPILGVFLGGAFRFNRVINNRFGDVQ